jgi:hypothetical protein
VRSPAMRRAVFAFALLAGALAGVSVAGVLADGITMSARPTISRANERVTATGIVSSGRPDQLVTLQSRPCDQTTWRDIAETLTHEGGGWTIDFSPGINGLFRATSAGAESEPLKLQTRPSVSLVQRPPGKFSVNVNAQRPFWHRKVELQRFDSKKRVWIVVRKVLLTEQGAPPGVGWVFTGSDKVAVKVPKGTTMRAVLPLSQTKPCYLAGYSNLLRR